MNALSLVFSNPVVAFIFLVAIVVFVHEFGHFIVGRILGIEVEEFSIGFGPRAVAFKKNGIEYKICWLPLGGYVRFRGQEPGQDIPLAKRNSYLTSSPVYKRILISLAGPAANFILSIIVMTGLSKIGLPFPSTIISVMPNSVAEMAGLQDGDLITKINQKDIKTWNELSNIISTSNNTNLNIELTRNEKNVKLEIVPKTEEVEDPFGEKKQNGRIGISQFLLTPRVVVANYSIFKPMGLQTGDLIQSINKKHINYFHEITNIVYSKYNVQSENQLLNKIKNKEILPTEDSILTFEIERTLPNKEIKQLILEFNPANKDTYDEIILNKYPKFTDVSSFNFTSLFSSDLLIKEFATLKQGDPRANAIESWKQCGMSEGSAIINIETTTTIKTPIQYISWLENKQNNFIENSSGKTASLQFGILDNLGNYKPLDCFIPLRKGKDHLNRERNFLDFPFVFYSSGADIKPIIIQSSSYISAVVDGTNYAFDQFMSIFNVLQKLITGKVPITNLGGPFAIAGVASRAAEAGLFEFFRMISLISINIGLFNLLPLPVLDGGNITLYVMEIFYGKPLPLSIQEAVQKIGIAFILFLFVFVFYNDILRFINFY